MESKFTFVIAEIVTTKYRVLISFDRYHLLSNSFYNSKEYFNYQR